MDYNFINKNVDNKRSHYIAPILLISLIYDLLQANQVISLKVSRVPTLAVNKYNFL